MQPQVHIITSIGLSGIIYFASNSLLAAAATFAGGALIDLDHLFDYFMYKKSLAFDWRDFFRSCNQFLINKFYLFLHSFELLAILWAITIFMHNNIYLLGFCLGVTLHFILDLNNIFSKRFSIFFYFLTFRARNNFLKENLLRK